MTVAGPLSAVEERVTTAPPGKTRDLYSNRERWTLLAVLFLASTSNYVDKNIIGVPL